ncbi:MAG: radical SAM protein [Desulfobacterales bacterium]|nr:radical SAM protein [Desulfobacterales bacterium]MDD4071851.1 radical SAM protein [Desulfobacterales bacterium]MDD4391512.1 radical SAM protein [Desulfobacterales bacterium]
MKRTYKYLFGPVPSRRFKRSLGVDLTPFKTCSLDCIFCQLGRTPEKTILRKEYVPIDEVISELEQWLAVDGQADYITLSGSGEPTLHSRFGEVLQYVRQHSDIPSVLLTNSTMLSQPEVREAACGADIVKMSLSAWDQASFEWVNRPHSQLQFDRLIQGQIDFRAQFKGKVWMEVFLLEAINATPDNVRKIARLAKKIGPDRIQLNTAIRPPAEDFASPVHTEQMNELARLFDPVAEVIAEYKTDCLTSIAANQDRIFSMLQRRPCTAKEITEVFGMHINEVSKYLGNLVRTNQVRTERKKTNIYYTAC